MVAHISVPYALADALCCLGLGFFLAALYDTARFFLGSSKTVCFVLDVLGFAAAAVLLCSFSAGRSYSGVVRWYMGAGLLGGMLGYFFVLAPATRALQKAMQWILKRPFLLLWIFLVRPLVRLSVRAGVKIGEKQRSKRKKRKTKQLQKKAQVLYNSN